MNLFIFLLFPESTNGKRGNEGHIFIFKTLAPELYYKLDAVIKGIVIHCTLHVYTQAESQAIYAQGQENIEHIQENNSTLNRQNSSLKEENAILNEQNDTLNKQNTTLNEQNVTLNQQNISLNQQNVEYRIKNAETKCKIGTAKNISCRKRESLCPISTEYRGHKKREYYF